MRKIGALVTVTQIVWAGTALAADLKARPNAMNDPRSSWDITFGGTLVSDYNIRGISQSARKPSLAGYIEPRYNITPNLQLYVGFSAEAIDFPNHAAAEIDIYGGVRRTFGKLYLDFGVWSYKYPRGTTFNGLGSAATCANGAFFFGLCNTIKGNLNYWEIYTRPTYTIDEILSVGGNIYYSPSSLNSSAPGTYGSLTAKVILPRTLLPKEIGAAVSVELGHYWLGRTDAFYGVPAFPLGIDLPNYTTWNIGLSLSYQVFTLDLRYYDTDLTKSNCNVLTSDHTATFGGVNSISTINPTGLVSNWCGAAFIIKLSHDVTLTNLR